MINEHGPSNGAGTPPPAPQNPPQAPVAQPNPAAENNLRESGGR